MHIHLMYSLRCCRGTDCTVSMLVLSVIAVLHTDSLMCLAENIDYTTDSDSKLSCVAKLRYANCLLHPDINIAYWGAGRGRGGFGCGVSGGVGYEGV